ncbi:filamentous haemagglutinin family protein [Bradyrhizobium sp. USDA 10063]
MLALALGGIEGAIARPLGGNPVSAPLTTINDAVSNAQRAAQTAQQVKQSLGRAAQALQAMQSLQNAARAAAQGVPHSAGLNINVPNGLTPGGLMPDLAAGWSGANAPAQSVAGGQTNVNIDQTRQQAILNWRTFNVGSRTTLTFDQHGNANWVALNRVDAGTGPSQILGNIKADGQVYVINQSGIIFGGGSQINVGALIASTAKMSDDQFLKGIYSTQTGSTWTPSFTDAAALLGNGTGGGIVSVEAGAQIATHAPASVTSGGGFVLLMGGQVINAGAITTPLGQTQFAAGDDFVLRRGYGTDQNIASTTRGNEIAPVLRAGSFAGLVRNDGMVFTSQGDITLAGRTIEQNGALAASTSVNTRGTIHLLNSIADTSGTVTLGAGSVTTVIPELKSDETALNSQRDALIAASAEANRQRAGAAAGLFNNLSLLADRLDQSRIEIVTGGNVIFKGGASSEQGSLTIAQGGLVAVSAGGRIFSEHGATIDVSGVRNVSLAMATNNIMVNIQGNELRDSPQNRDSNALKNADVWLDIRDLTYVPSGTGGYEGDRYYTPGGLLEVGGYLANTKHTIGEWSAVGGTITLSALEVIAQSGSVFDISGGSVRYEAGYIRTTNFLGSDGRLYNISDARADMTFYGLGQGFIRKHERWNVTEVWTSTFGRGRESVRWEDGYTVGRDAGRLILSTPTAIFEGTILADVVQGQRQIGARPDGASDGYKLSQSTVPFAGTLALGRYAANGLLGVYDTDVVIGDRTALSLPEDHANTAWFDAGYLNAQNLGSIEIATAGKITIDAPLSVVDGGSVSLVAPIVDINADITARNGSILSSNTLIAQTPIVLTHGGVASVTLGASLNVTGRWVNALLDPTGYAQTAFIDGGSVRLESTGNVTLAADSLIDASAGAAIGPSGSVKGGRGGDAKLAAGYSSASGIISMGGTLTFDGDIRAYGFAGGGTLTLHAGARDVSIAGEVASSDTVLTLRSDTFRKGFSHYVVSTALGMRIDGDVEAIVPVYRATEASHTAVSDRAISEAAELWLPPTYLENAAASTLTRRAGADIALVGVDSFVLAEGKTIKVDPGRIVEIQSHGQTTIDGTILARGGNVVIGSDLHGLSMAIQTGTPGQSIWIGEHARLDVSAEAVIRTDNAGHRYGVVSDGGSIRIGLESLTPDATTGTLPVTQSMVVVRPGAVLDASGTNGMLDLPLDNGILGSWTPSAVASNGGSIMIGSMAGLYLDGELRAAAGGAGAAGGSLTLVLENAISAPAGRPPHVLTVTQQRVGSGLPAGLTAGEADPAIPYNTARISAEQVTAGGFDDLLLWSRDVLRFDDDVHLSTGRSLALYRGVLSAATADTRVTLSAPHVLLDGAVDIYQPEGTVYPGLNLGVFVPATTNHGSLRVEADLIDVRNRIWSGAWATYRTSATGLSIPFETAGFGAIDLVSRSDIRFGTGFLVSGGNSITLEAAQIYPLTEATAVVGAGIIGSVPGADGVITVRGNGSKPALPQSVFGSLGLVAATIDQGGILRAPLGKITLGDRPLTMDFFPRVPNNIVTPPVTVTLREGSITSTSAAALIMPYGGTIDGQVYSYAGAKVAFTDLANMLASGGVTLKAERVVAEPGSLLDLSGGGTLTGAGFITGRGGSVDVLRTPLVNANPANAYSNASNRIYALVPGYAGSYAPLSPDHGAGDPMVGQQITLSRPVGSLPAGTYTLLPSTYALLPGAWRVEIGGATTSAAQTAALGNGSYVSAGTLGFANTNIRAALPNRLVLTPAHKVRTYSQYNETSYSDFARANAELFGLLRPRLPVDAQVLTFDFKMGTGDVLSFDGDANFAPAEDGYAGILTVQLSTHILFNPPDGTIEIRPSDAAPTQGMASLSAEDLSRFNAGSLLVGGVYSFTENTNSNALEGPRVNFIGVAQNTNIFVRSGATLQAGQIFLIAANQINVASGAVLDTTHSQARVFDSTAGYVFANWGNLNPNTGVPVAGAKAVLTVANGEFNFLAPAIGPTGTIIIEDGAVLRTLGTIDFTASQGVNLGTDVALNARYLSLSLPEINVGTEASLDAARAAGALGSGWTLTQSVLDSLLTPGDATLRGVERLTLAATSSLNFFGDVSLDMRGGGSAGGRTLVLNTPAIYGWGTDNDVATLATDTLIWNGSLASNGVLASPYGALTPPAQRPGTGTGTLRIDAREIVFGYGPGDQYQNETALDRLALGFSTVDLVASERITANNRGTLSVYRSYDLGAKTYAGGNLNLMTPLITAQGGGYMAYTAGGAITARAPQTGPAGTTDVRELGGELRFNGDTISIDTGIALPSGRLALKADGDITLADRARIDLSGRSIAFFDVTKHGWGGDVDMRSTNGRIVQAAGSVIDVSADHNEAGSITVEAVGTGGSVAFNGTLRGKGAEGYDDGGFDVRARILADFAALNRLLNAGAFFQSRSMAVKTGNLVVGDEVRARHVSLSADGGSLTVVGTIDASGASPGTIRLSARDDVTLASTAVLDAHGTVLQVDGKGQPIEAKNRGHVELTSTEGWIGLASGATIDLTAADGVARGHIEINAQRLGGAGGAGAGANDIAIDAAGPLDIRGAASIAVNGFRRYDLPDGGIIDQDLLNGIHGDSTVFVDAALANAGLQNRLAGLRAYGEAFHLRPGVEIWSEGDLATQGDIDFSGYRYGPQANPALRGSGEAGVVWVRAGGDFKVNGSITDGFGRPLATPDDNGWILPTGIALPNDVTVPVDILLPGNDSGAFNTVTTFPNTAGLVLEFEIPLRSLEIKPNVVIPVQVELAGQINLPAGFTLKGDIIRPDGMVLAAGTTLAASTVIPVGSKIARGNVLPTIVFIRAMTWPAGTPLDVINSTQIALREPITIRAGTVVPTGVTIPRISQTLTADTVMSAPMVLASGSTIPVTAGVKLAFPITLGVTTLKAGATIPFAFKTSGVTILPAGWTPSARILNADGTVAFEANKPVPAGARLMNNMLVEAGITLPPSVTVRMAAGTIVAKDTVLGNYFTGSLSLSAPAFVEVGMTLPRGATVQNLVGATLRSPGSDGAQGHLYALAPMLDPGMQSWSMRYVAGADLGAADTRSVGVSRAGDLVLNDPHYHFGSTAQVQQAMSVLRTGTGYLDLLAGGDYQQKSLFGVYTAGAQTGSVGRDTVVSGDPFAAALHSARFYFTEGGGDVLLAAQGNLQGYSAPISGPTGTANVSSMSANWLLKNGDDWGINFGTYDMSTTNVLRGFASIGSLGGGNVVVKSGGDAQGLTAAVGSSGQAQADGARILGGGGDLTLDIAGSISSASLVDLRGDIDLRAASVGTVVAQQFGKRHDNDPRALDLAKSYGSLFSGVSSLSIGDGVLTAYSRSELVAAVTGESGLSTDATRAVLFSGGGDVGLGVSTVSSLSVVAAGGDILLRSSGTLAPSPRGQLEFLAWDSINGRGDLQVTGIRYWTLGAGDLTSNLHIDDPEPIRLYAVNGDILNVRLGNKGLNTSTRTWSYTDIVGKQAWLLAGRDIVGLNAVILNNRTTDVSRVSAGRDIIYANVDIAGPGTLEVTAGRNVYQADKGAIASLGPLVRGDTQSGADIAVMAGIGAGAPGVGNVAWGDFANLYLNLANLADRQRPLADQPGKVAKTYEKELAQWLFDRYGFRGGEEAAFAYFATLSPEQQRIFLRQVYFTELLASGREYNNPDSTRFNSYLRGRYAIAALFPETDAAGTATTRHGDLILFQGPDNNSGIRTIVGGSIQTLVPNGQITIGISGVTPATDRGFGPPMTPAGLLTQGQGDIRLYSQESILLGLSRIMTTFGGDIQAWSAEGDINAGRGAKTTIVYTPPRRVYDAYGNVALSPNVPSSGAGVATLNPIPGIPAGNIDLIAPLGTIDAGEAGIRSSGNVNLAALQILNAANIQAQGNVTGVPTVQAPPVAVLATSNNLTAATQQAQPAVPTNNDRPSIIMVEFLGFGGGDGGDAPLQPQRDDNRQRRSEAEDPNSRVQVLAVGDLTPAQRRQLLEKKRPSAGQ